MSTQRGSDCIIRRFIQSVQDEFPYDSHTFFIVPEPVITLITSYTANLFQNYGIFTWKITDPQIVHDILHANIGEKFESEPFRIARLHCKLEIYPNGDNPDMQGYLIIHLRLLSLPPNIARVECGRVFRVLENKAAAAYSPTISVDMHDYWSNKCPLSELVKLSPPTISIQVELYVLELFPSSVSKPELPEIPSIWRSVLEKEDKEQQRTRLMQTAHFEFNLDKRGMEIFRSSMVGKPMCTEIANDNYVVTVFPCGADEDTAGYISIYFQLLKFPRNVKQMKFKYKVDIEQVDDGEAYYEDTSFLEENERAWIGVDYLLSTRRAGTFEQMTFVVDIEILDVVYKDEADGDDQQEKQREALVNPVDIAYLLTQ